MNQIDLNLIKSQGLQDCSLTPHPSIEGTYLKKKFEVKNKNKNIRENSGKAGKCTQISKNSQKNNSKTNQKFKKNKV